MKTETEALASKLRSWDPTPATCQAAAVKLCEMEQEIAELEGVVKLLRRQRDRAERALDILRGKDPLDKFTGTE